jgi:trk system potassium uptake protein TrkH
MTVITLFSFLINRRIGLKERGLLQESISTMHIGGVVYLIKKF